ncbi:MAG: hypothetical protein K2L94_02615 [Alphaproteobacteria bacterium]|nr:hypothetical protein [Alphaproteobacteria bacterium]
MKTYPQIFDTLNKTRHTRADGAECWYYSDINNLYNIQPDQDQPSHTQTLAAMLNNPTVSKDATRIFRGADIPTVNMHRMHVQHIHHDYTITTGLCPRQVYNGHDLDMSRYACWALMNAQHGIPAIFAQTYFLYPDVTYERLCALTNEFTRIPARRELAQVEKIMAGILYRTGTKIPLFNQMVHQTLFADITVPTIKQHYRIPIKSSDPLSNYMGTLGLMAKTTALQNTIAEYDRRDRVYSDMLMQIVAHQLRKQRAHMINKYGVRPEQNIHTTPVSKVSTHLNQAIRQFSKNYANIGR